MLLINARSLEHIELYGSLVAHEGCVYRAHTINICASYLIFADSYGASQGLLLESTWKAQDRKMAKSVKYGKYKSIFANKYTVY